MLGDSHWGNLRSALVGAVVAAVVMLSFPAVAAVGDALKLGQANSANAVTSLSGSAAANLRLTNSQAGAPALDLRVQDGSAPLAVNSITKVQYLNADRLDGKHGRAYSLEANKPKVSSCSEANIDNGDDWACPMTITLPATGSVLMSGSVDFYNDSASHDDVWCGFYLGGSPEPSSVRQVTIPPGDWGTCTSDVRVAAGAGTYTLEFQLNGVGANTGPAHGSAWMLFVSS